MIVQSKIEIESSTERIFKILLDGMSFPKWNIAIDTIERIQSAVEGKHFFLKTAVGDINVINFEYLKNDNIVWHMEDSAMNSIGYSLIKKGEDVEVTLWVDFDDVKNKELFLETQKYTLDGLKQYAEYLEDGGDPEEYDKLKTLISPL